MAAGDDFDAALSATREESIFTTHTPVPAGHDRFHPGLMSYALNRYEQHLSLSSQGSHGAGRLNADDEDETFCMTVLALNTARAANGVSELHGAVSREMWQGKYDVPVDDVPIGHVTNGIHLLGWMSKPARDFWQPRVDAGELFHEKNQLPGILARVNDPEFISDEELWHSVTGSGVN